MPDLFRFQVTEEYEDERIDKYMACLLYTSLLISDRAGCSPEMLEMIKQDIAKVISKYMKIDTNNMEIQISKSTARGRGKNPTLYADIPILDLHN